MLLLSASCVLLLLFAFAYIKKESSTYLKEKHNITLTDSFFVWFTQEDYDASSCRNAKFVLTLNNYLNVIAIIAIFILTSILLVFACSLFCYTL